MAVRAEWDEKKNTANVAKHAIDFRDAIRIFEEPESVIELASPRKGEERVLAFGLLSGRVVAVAYTMRGSSRRTISARKASSRERQAYEKTKVKREKDAN